MSKSRTTPPRSQSPSHQAKRYQQPRGPAGKNPAGKVAAGKPGPQQANVKRQVPPAAAPGVATPGLVGIGMVIGLTGHIVEQANGEPWWSAQNAYAADADAARQALLGVSPQDRPPESIAPADPDLDPRPPVFAAIADSGPEQPAVSFLDGLNTPSGLVVPADPAIQRYLHHYVETKEGKEKFKNWMRRGGEYDRMIEGALRKHRVPVALKALVFVESAFNPEAVSPVGASGMWQFMEATARGYDLTVEPGYDQRFDPYAASNAAAKHLADLYEETQDWPLALAAYNYGLGNVRARLEEAGARTFWELAAQDGMLPQETRQYVPRIMAIAVALSNLEHYGLDKVDKSASAPRTTRYEPPMGVPLSLLARAAGTSTNQLLKLNPQLRNGEIPATGTAVTLNVKGSWYSKIQATLPLLMEDGVARRDLEVDANFDWGTDEFVEPVDGAVAANAEPIPLARQIGPNAERESTTASASITPAPILGVGGAGKPVAAVSASGGVSPNPGVSPVAVPAHHVGSGLPDAPAPTAASAPLKASPILPIVQQAPQAAEKTAPAAEEKVSEEKAARAGGLLPIRLPNQGSASNAPTKAGQGNAAASFVPLGVTTSETR